MIYNIFHPAPALASIVEHYSYTKVDMTTSAIEHFDTPLMQGMAFNFHKKREHHAYDDKVITLYKQAYFFGQPTCPRVITTDEKGIDVIGVKFKPLGISRITGLNMEHMTNTFIEPADIWGAEFEQLCDEMQSENSMDACIQVLDKFLLKKYLLTSQHRRVREVEAALILMNQSRGAIDLKTLGEKINITQRTLERSFLNCLGLSPKLYSQIVRYNAAKKSISKSMGKESILDIAYELGYYDGSHFAAEFKRFSGQTTTAYLQTNKIRNIII